MRLLRQFSTAPTMVAKKPNTAKFQACWARTPLATPPKFCGSSSARRRYFDRSSLISDRATRFIAFTMFRKPGIGLRFRHNRQDVDHPLGHIVEHPNIVSDAQSILGTRKSSQPLDAALAHLGRL